MPYCIYTNSEFLKTGPNKDHIISLALGGHNEFAVDAEPNFNSRFSTEVEGKLANDFLIQMNRNYFDLRGHSKTEVIPTREGKTEDGKKVKIYFDKASKKVSIQNIISRDEIQNWKKTSFSLSMSLDPDPYLRLAAKISLGTGYFLFRDLFVQNVEHDELRLIMNGTSKLSEEKRKMIKTRCYIGRWFSSKEDRGAKEYQLYSKICKSTKGSVVIMIPTTQSLCFHVGIAGEYIGMMNVPARTDQFLEKYKNNIGHIVMITNGTFKEGILRSIST